MEINSLNYYLKVAETLNFRKAAEELFVSQSTLSRQIAVLEKEIGAELFERTTRSVMLTEAGKECLESARTAVNAFQNMKLKAGGISGKREGEIKLGFFGHDTVTYISRVYEYMIRAYPAIELTVYDEPVEALEYHLECGEYDVVILLKPCIRESDKVIRKTLSHEVPSVVLRDSHPLSRCDEIDLSELKNEKFISLPPSKTHRVYSELLNLCRENGFEPDFELNAGYNASLRVAMGEGILLDPFTARDNNALPGLKRIPVSCDDRFDRQLMYLKKNKNPMMPYFLEVIDDMLKNGEFKNELLEGIDLNTENKAADNVYVTKDEMMRCLGD